MDQGSHWTSAFGSFLPEKYVLNGLIYNICEVYIDDMLVFGENEDALIRNVRIVFQRFREKNVTLNTKKLVVGFDTSRWT